MKNWVKDYHSIFEKYKISLTHWFGKKLLNDKKYKWRLLASLQFDAKRREERLLGKTACPENIDVDLFSIAYVDSYFLEEFEQLEYGLANIISKYGSSIGYFKDYYRVREWILECSSKSYGHGTTNVGWLSLKSEHKKEFNFLFDSFQIHLSHFSPSIITLILIIKPSSLFKEKFQKIITSDAKQELNIKRISLKSGITSISFMPENMVREVEIDEFFLEANKYVVQFLRKNIGVGLAMNGPLKNIEVLKLKQSLKIFPESTRYDRKEFKIYEDFFKTLGKLFYHLPYFTDWYNLYYINRSKHYAANNMQALLSEEDYKPKINENKREDIDSEMFMHFTYILTGIGTLLSIEFLLDDLNTSVLNLRNKLTKHMLNKRITNIFTNSIRKNTMQYSQMNETHFKYQRIYNELDKELLKSFFSQEIEDLNRKKYKEEGKEHFTVDIINSIERKTTFIEKQIQFLKSSYSDFIHLRFTKSNYNFQFVLVLLTIILTVLTILLVLQEETINTIKTVFKWIIGLV